MSVSTGRDMAAVAAGESAAELAGEVQARVIELATRRPPRARLTPWQRMEVERARELLMHAPDLFASKPDAYVAGLIEGAAANLLGILDAVTEV